MQLMNHPQTWEALVIRKQYQRYCFFSIFCKRFLGAKWRVEVYRLQMRALAESYRVWQPGRGGKFGVRMLGEIWQRFGQASSDT